MATKHDIGEIMNNLEVPSKDKNKKFYPSTRYSSKKLPGIDKYEVGEDITLESSGKVISKREKEDGDVEVEVETHECAVVGGKKGMDKVDYDKMSDEEKDRHDEKEVMEKDDK